MKFVWMFITSFLNYELAFAQTRPVGEQIRDLKEVVQPSPKLPSARSEFTEGTSNCLCEAVTAADTSARPPAACDIKGARDDLKLLPQDWGLKATGADLLRDDPILKSIKYQNKLAIVDSGLQLRGNPEAGKKLIDGSPEEDAGIFHGTHVAGIAASAAHGVNPYLTTKVFPVPSNPFTDGSKTEDLLNSLDQAVNDKFVKVINLSWSFREQPKMVDLVRRATERGKLIVFAAGNENEVANIQTSGHDHFMRNAAFFKVGASSYFGSPSAFSNFGPDVAIYAPGSHIQSLDGAYNPNYAVTKPSVVKDGTSMAAPHFASVLTTLTNLAPGLDAASMQELIKMTAINRGTDKRPFYFLNSYLAFQTVAVARECLKTKKPARECLNESRLAVQSKATLPRPPKGSACNDWRLYYTALRKAYFLTQGHGEVVKALQDLFADEPKPIAEKFLFLNRDSREFQNTLLKDQTIPGIYRSELVRTLDFLSGKLDLEKVASHFDQENYETYGLKDFMAGREPPKDKHPLELLLPIKENHSDFLKYCEADLKSEKSQGPCANFVGNAPRQFKENLIEHLSSREPPTVNASILGGLNFGYDKAYDEKVRGLYQKAIEICLRGALCKITDLDSFYDSVFSTKDQKSRLSRLILDRAKRGEFDEDLDPANRSGFIDYWRTMNEIDDASKSEEDKARQLKEDLIRQGSVQNSYLGNMLKMSAKASESEEATRLRYSSLVVTQGHSVKDLRGQIEGAVLKTQDFKVFGQEGESFRASIQRIANSDAVEVLADYLSDAGNVAKFHQAYHSTSEFSSLVAGLLKNDKVSLKYKERLIGALKRAVKTSGVGHAAIYDGVLMDSQEEPVVKAWLDEIKTPSGAKQYPEMAQSALWRSAQLDHDTPEFQKLIQVNKTKPSEWIFWASPKLVMETPHGDKLIEKAFDRIINSPNETEAAQSTAWQWVNKLDGKPMGKFAPAVLKALPTMLRAKVVPVDKLLQFVQKLVENVGANREIIQKTIEILRPFIKEEQFLWRTSASNVQTKKEVQEFEANGFIPDRGASILIQAYTLLNDSVEGRKLLKDHPIWAELHELGREKVAVEIPSYSISFSPQSASIPEPMKSFYVGKVEEHLRTLTNDSRIMGQQRKFQTAIVNNPELIDPVVRRLGDLKDGSEAYRYLGGLIVDFAKKSPQNASLIMSKFGAKNPTYYQVMLFGQVKTKPLKEEIQRYLDYEK